jgi:hypothetical protein
MGCRLGRAQLTTTYADMVGEEQQSIAARCGEAVRATNDLVF